YKGVGELGMIAGVGMLVSFLMSFTVLPACLSVLPAQKNKRPSGDRKELSHHGTTETSSKYFITLLVVFVSVGIYISKDISFDINPLHLNNQDAESVKTLYEISLDKESPLDEISFIASDMANALQIKKRLSEVSEVGDVTLVSSFIPQKQASKLTVIDELGLVIGGEFQLAEDIDVPNLDLGALKTSLIRNIETIKQHSEPSKASLLYNVQLQKILNRVSTADRDQNFKYAQDLEAVTMRHFSPLIKKLNEGLSPNLVTFENLPAVLKSRWVTEEGRIRLQINPQEPLDSNDKISDFIAEVRKVTGPSATGTPIVSLEASRSVLSSFAQAFATACLVIIGVLWVSLRKSSHVVIALVPMLLACVATTSIMVLVGLPFNFANIIALPLIVGIGVDSTLHIIHRHINQDGLSINFMQTSTARGVFLSTLTTMASFGNLAISPHAGTGSMGLLLSLGLSVTLISTLGCLPLLLRRYVKRGAEIAT
ncbi:MAG: MMPL family transporter, partial [Proteobacteria bacterium]|nr:MMPL family transporter [Pseudomonadota bacterium]